MERKTRIDGVLIEITRRCNFDCLHCLRGEPQNIDFDTNLLIKFLEVNNIISLGNLCFTGGEPTLRLDIMYKIIDILLEKQISIDMFYMKTNGSKIKNFHLFFDFLVKLHELIDRNLGKSTTTHMVRKFKDEAPICIQVSSDIFHNECDKRDPDTIDKLLMFNCCDIDDYQSSVQLMGRAIKNQKLIEEKYENVQFVDPLTPPNPDFNIYGDEIRITCDYNITLTCTGKLLKTCDYEFEKEDDYLICKYNEPLINNIDFVI